MARFVSARTALGLLLVTLVASPADAFVISPLPSLSGGRVSATAVRMSERDGSSTTGARGSRRVLMEGFVALSAGAVLRPLGAFAEEDDEDEDDSPAPATQAREVTFKADDSVCEKHPTWKQCRKAAKKTGGSSKSPQMTMDNGLTYKELSVGKGNIPQNGDTVTVHYSLYYQGDEIESSRESSGLAAAPLGFQYGSKSGAGSVIPAINDGITGMKVGGIRRVVAPPELAFGAKGKKPRIPGDATVEFDLQLLTVKRAGTNPISSQGRGSEKNTGLFDLF